MFYIHQTSCISPQHTFRDVDINKLVEPAERKLQAIEPSYDVIPPGVLRRMGKAVRMGVGAAMPLLQNNLMPDGIIIGTGTGGKDDCVKFLNQIIEYDEGMLTPINFVQSTPNAVAAQVGLLTKNHGYNITHLHLGLAFEFAMTDADMMLNENPLNSYLLGGVDDISINNYYFEDKRGWYKKEDISDKKLYEINTPGSIAGEAAAMFLVNGTEAGSVAKVLAVDTLHHQDESIIKEKLQDFIEKHLPAGEKIDLLLTGENGDNRLLKYYSSCEEVIKDDVTIARFKHMCGEYPTATAVGLWLCCDILQNQHIPHHMIKNAVVKTTYKNILIYNSYKGVQHSFILVSGQ
ncbi:MAG: beta-ketoacyl synthase chain length factor [Bacteroidia bacterium]|nr:beta-ketoacyl synthase chain length factor [Bacteroidia bacterium]